MPPRSTGPGAAAIAVRVAFALIPTLSLGLLAWVPSLRFAIIRRRNQDWAVLGLFCALTAAEIILVAYIPDDADDGLSALVGFYLVAYFIGATLHAVLADRFPRPTTPGYPAAPPPTPYHPTGYGYPPAPAPVVAPPVPPAPVEPRTSPRMRQVASELDELGEYLRRAQHDPRQDRP
ncbi:hypothetical protein [Streptomyces millisiae]|uniref:Integral membrane protein n=1 Tax=Streptomyces millisiae TaxID=3075542 RepID=A0ABU2LQR3_9ACTN|nr:hypothetical protein [Streptomyces sp. DSM 44918]MDT0319608.1 hypothetical protein [Streptomyces sp. DSM 44918]